jgi:outer membrane receptor for ferrienterochelin and colicins
MELTLNKILLFVLYLLMAFVATSQTVMLPLASEKNSTIDSLNEVVVTGSLKAVKRLESPIPVEVYNQNFLRKNPTANIFEGLQLVNGLRPQISCNVCNTGDIRINGLPGAYSMVLIDGMPIVSSLSTVYGLFGIPNALIERIEVVKGPASTLFGSEAVGGVINIITKQKTTQNLMADVMTSSHNEHMADISFSNTIGKAQVLTGINVFNFNKKLDANNDGFTDRTLENRISLFQRWKFNRQHNRIFTIAGRYMYEDRWGGQLNWNKNFRGGDSIYGESIYTNRAELISNYQLPTKERIFLATSYNYHHQNSVYGTTLYNAKQHIGFAQLTWDKTIGKHSFLAGATARYTWYDDNTPATFNNEKGNLPSTVFLPGMFVQNETKFNAHHSLVLGVRYDYHPTHKHIATPRLAYKYSFGNNHIIRLNMGTGFRVVNIFTEDHAALTGARTVEISNRLNPERSYNINLTYNKKFNTKNGAIINIETAAWYTYFNNRIIADYDTDPNKIIYNNLNGYSISKGISGTVDAALPNGLKLSVGGTLMDVSLVENGIKERPVLTEQFSGVYTLGYEIKPWHLQIDITGNVFGPMRLPLLGNLDPRSEFSPTYSTHNVQFTLHGLKKFELYFGVKNIFNFTPFSGNNPFIIARANDPFDKQVQFDNNGQVMSSANNPFALTFDPTYAFTSLQGIRAFVGIRTKL